VRQRLGAIGSSLNCARLERFWRSLKEECLDATCAWMREDAIRAKTEAYVEWHARHRPHQGLAGRTPDDVRRRRKGPRRLELRDGDRVKVTRVDLRGDRSCPVYRLAKVG
jgi:hypothetical protein